MSRKAAREFALQTLFHYEFNTGETEQILELFFFYDKVFNEI